MRKDAGNHLGWLDSLRGIGCFIVMIAHIVAYAPEIGVYASGCGKIGVWLFMLISGFLVLREEKKFSFCDLKNYYINRILRIYPSFLIALILGLALGLFNGEDLRDMLFFRSAWHHFWYMPVIIVFSLIAPVFRLFYSFVRDRFTNSKLIMASILIVGIVAFSFLFPFTSYPENSIEIKWYLPVFMIGMLLALLETVLSGMKKKRMDLLALIGMIMIIIETPFMREVLWGIPPSGYLQNKYLYMACAWSLVFVGLMGGEVCRKVLEKCRVLQYIGSISYEVYLFHYPILVFFTINGLLGSPLIRGIVTVVGAIGISVLVKELLKLFHQCKRLIQLSAVCIYYGLLLVGSGLFR